MDMWPKPAEGVEENGIRKRIKGVAYKCTRCSQFGHNAKSCKSKTQDPDGLKRKRKPPKGKTKQGETQATAPAQQATATASAQATASQSLFDDISDEVMSSIPDIIADFIPNKNKSEAGKDNAVKDKLVKSKAVKNKDVKHKSVKDKDVKVQQPVKLKRRCSERNKLNWLKKPIIGPGSSSNQPIKITEADEGILTQEDSAMV